MKPTKLPRNVWVATLASMLTDISSEMIVYLLPIFLANVLKTSTPLIGLIEGFAETTTSLSKLASGYISDRFQNRKVLVVAGYGVSTIAKAFLVFANGWQAVFAARTADRLGKGIRGAPRDALIAESVEASQRGAAFGFHRAGDTFGAFIGVGLSMLLVFISQQQAQVLSRDTFITVVLVSMIPAVAAVVLLAVGLRENKRSERISAIKLPSLSLGQFNVQFKLFLLIVGWFTLGNSADAFIVLRAQERGANILTVLAMVLTFNLIYAVGAQPLGVLSDKVGRAKVIMAGWLVYGLAYLGFAFANQIWQFWLLWAFYGLYYALTEGAAKSLIADLVNKEQRGTAYGYFNASVGILALPASLLAGFLWQNISPSAPFLFGSVIAATSVVGIFLLNPKREEIKYLKA